MNETRMLSNEEDAIAHLRSRGYAVVVWTPDELRGAEARVIEHIALECMSDAIGILATEPLDATPGGLTSVAPSLPHTAPPASRRRGPSSFLESLCLKLNWSDATATVRH